MKEGRALLIVGGVLLLISTMLLVLVFGALTSIGSYYFDWYLALMPIIQFICGLLLLISDKEMITLAAGLMALFFSLSVGGILGIIGGILGLVGTFVVSAKTPLTEVHTPETFQKNCVNCGRRIPIASEECSHCGANQESYSDKRTMQPLPPPPSLPLQSRASPETQKSERLFCIYCGAENKSYAVFCSKCGKKIVD
jgi:ribosomal protein L40E